MLVRVALRRSPLSALKRLVMSTALHITEVDGQASTVYLHGLLGNGKNLKTMATKFGGGILLDLRGHGKSPTGSQPHSFEKLAKDVLETVEIENSTVIVGHSLGGRVALECALLLSDIHNETTTWLLDTVPGKANKSVEKVIDAIQSINPRDYENRQQLVRVLHQERQLEMDLAQWLSSGVSSSPNGMEWGFDLSVVNALMSEFGSQNFMGKLEHLVLDDHRDNVVHLVIGGMNTEWTSDILSKLEDLAIRSNGKLFVHTLPDAGHWIHVDDLPGLVSLWEAHSRL